MVHQVLLQLHLALQVPHKLQELLVLMAQQVHLHPLQVPQVLLELQELVVQMVLLVLPQLLQVHPV